MNGIEMEGREFVRQAFARLAEYLAGGTEIEGARFRGGATLTIRARLEADSVIVAIDEPQPIVSKKLGPFSLSGPIQGARVTRDELTVEIDGLPDTTIKLR